MISTKKLALQQFCQGIERYRLKPIFSDSTSQRLKNGAIMGWSKQNGMTLFVI
ncbi:MAG: hypothetical protein AB8W37_02285 [Arsenophonus endosymbiont of Dermacentor nuttalli]